MPRPARMTIAPIALVLTSIAVAGCQSSQGDAPHADGLGEARVALYASSMYGYGDDLHGRVLLVSENGDVRAVETEGLYLGSVSVLADTVFASDESSEVAVGPSSVEALDRDQEYDTEWWAGVSGTYRWSMFNVGTRDSDTYFMGLTATNGAQVHRTEVEGDVVGNVVCNDQVLAAIGEWEHPQKLRGTRISSFTVRGDSIAERPEEILELPAGVHVTNLACLDKQVVVFAMRGKTTMVGTVDGDGSRRWDRVPAGFNGSSRILGAIGGEIFSFAPYEGVRALALSNLATRQVVRFSDSQANAKAAIADGEVVAWVPDTQGPSVIRWYDLRSGAVVDEISGDEVAELLADFEETIARGPAVIPAG